MEGIVKHHKRAISMARLWCLTVVGTKGRRSTQKCAHMGTFLCWPAGIEKQPNPKTIPIIWVWVWGLVQMKGELLSTKTRAMFLCSAGVGLRRRQTHKTCPWGVFCVFGSRKMGQQRKHVHMDRFLLLA